MLSQTWDSSPMNLHSYLWIESLTYACGRMSLSTYKSTFSRMDWLSHLCLRTHEPFYQWFYLLTYGLILSPMLSHAWLFAPMNLPSDVWIDSFIYAFSCMSLFTYESTFSRIYWLSHLCFLTHEPFHLWIYLLTYGLTLSPIIFHAWAFSCLDLPSHVWIDSLTYAFSRMSLFTYQSTFSRMDWLSHLCFLTHEPFHLWIYLFTYGLTLSAMLSHAWASSPMNLLSHV